MEASCVNAGIEDEGLLGMDGPPAPQPQLFGMRETRACQMSFASSYFLARREGCSKLAAGKCACLSNAFWIFFGAFS
jgi:hypothetical protein